MGMYVFRFWKKRISKKEQCRSTNPDSIPRLQRVKRPPLWMQEVDVPCFCNEEDEKHVENPDKWHEAINDEIKSHFKIETWTVIVDNANLNKIVTVL